MTENKDGRNRPKQPDQILNMKQQRKRKNMKHGAFKIKDQMKK